MNLKGRNLDQIRLKESNDKTENNPKFMRFLVAEHASYLVVKR